MTKRDRCIELGLLNKDGSSIEGKVFDYALPQCWLDDISRLNENSYHPEWFVWLYDTMGGRPYALCNEGWNQIMRYNSIRGTRYKIEKTKEIHITVEVIN